MSSISPSVSSESYQVFITATFQIINSSFYCLENTLESIESSSCFYSSALPTEFCKGLTICVSTYEVNQDLSEPVMVCTEECWKSHL